MDNFFGFFYFYFYVFFELLKNPLFDRDSSIFLIFCFYGVYVFVEEIFKSLKVVLGFRFCRF